MFESNEDIGNAVETIYKLSETLRRGDVLSHEQIQNVLGVRPHEGQWGQVMNRVRRRLERDRGIATWPVKNVGYELLTAARQLELPVWRLRKGRRQATRARKSVEALPEKGLTLNQRRARLFAIERTREAERSIRREIRSQSEELKPSQTLPRRRVAAEAIG